MHNRSMKELVIYVDDEGRPVIPTQQNQGGQFPPQAFYRKDNEIYLLRLIVTNSNVQIMQVKYAIP